MSTRDLVTGAAVGAALLFVLDPNRGAKRRALLRDKLVRARRIADEGARATARDMSNRARGVAASVRGRLSNDDAPSTIAHVACRCAGTLVGDTSCTHQLEQS